MYNSKNQEYPSKIQKRTKKGVPGSQESQTQNVSLHLQLSEQTEHQLDAHWECSKSLAHSVKMSDTLWNNGPGTTLKPRYSSKGCTQERSPEQNKACAVKELTTKEIHKMCAVTKAKERCQERPREERREGQKVSLLDGADKEGIYQEVNLSKDLKKGRKHSDKGRYPQGQRDRHQRLRTNTGTDEDT